MKKDTTSPSEGAAAPEKSAAGTVQVVCEVLENGMLYQDAHHAKGKQLVMSENSAAVYTKMDPPALKVLGVSE